MLYEWERKHVLVIHAFDVLVVDTCRKKLFLSDEVDETDRYISFGVSYRAETPPCGHIFIFFFVMILADD